MTGALIKSDKASNQLSFKNALKLCAFIVSATVACQIPDTRASKETNVCADAVFSCYFMKLKYVTNSRRVLL